MDGPLLSSIPTASVAAASRPPAPPPTGAFVAGPVAVAAAPIANPAALLDQQLRFGVSGSGPAGSRRITPVTSAARELVQTTPGVLDRVRELLRVVDRAAAPGSASGIPINGVAFAADQAGHAVNVFGAHADSDAAWKRTFDAAGTNRPAIAAKLLEDSMLSAPASLAMVTAGWMNLGPAASAALLGAHGIAGLPPPSIADAALAVRVIRHESEHLADTTTPQWMSAGAVGALRESLAEANSSSPRELAATRDLLGLGALVPDASLGPAIAVRPYPQYEQALGDLLRQAGLDPATPQAQRLVTRPAAEVADTLVDALVRAGASRAGARSTVDARLAGG